MVLPGLRCCSWVHSASAPPARLSTVSPRRSLGGTLAKNWRRKGSARSAFAGESRSEEHTSELQSLMRISYAVFCLKKKKKQPRHQQNTHVTAINNILSPNLT